MAELNVLPFGKGDIIQIVNDAQKAGHIIFVPALPADAATSTYTLKATNGVFGWVKDED